MPKSKYEVGPVESLRGGHEIVAVDGKKYLVCHQDGEFIAYRNVCPHQYGPAVEGIIRAEDQVVICPWHGWEFDLRTGENPHLDGCTLPQVSTVVEDGIVYLKL